MIEIPGDLLTSLIQLFRYTSRQPSFAGGTKVHSTSAAAQLYGSINISIHFEQLLNCFYVQKHTKTISVSQIVVAIQQLQFVHYLQLGWLGIQVGMYKKHTYKGHLCQLVVRICIICTFLYVQKTYISSFKPFLVYMVHLTFVYILHSFYIDFMYKKHTKTVSVSQLVVAISYLCFVTQYSLYIHYL